MAELKVGLAANRTSYFDAITNTYITLQKPVQSIVYDENNMAATVKRLEKVTHALLASVPALILYEGKIPQECIDHWKNKFMKPFNTATTRNVVVNGKVIQTIPVADPLRDSIDYEGRQIEANRAFDRPEKVNAKSKAPAEPEAPVEGKSVGKAEELKLDLEPAEVVEEKPKAKAARGGKAAAKSEEEKVEKEK